MKYFLAPRSGEKSYENYQSTIRYGVPLDRIAPFLTQEEISTVTAEDIIYVWGNRKGKQREWREMENGDLIIFYAHGKLIMTGEAYLKKHSPELALALWPRDKKGNPWEFVFFIKNVKYISVPIEIFNEAVGYKTNKVVMGFTLLQQFRIDKVVERYGSIEELLGLFKDQNSEEIPRQDEKVYMNLPSSVVPLVIHDAPLKPRVLGEYVIKSNAQPIKIDYVARNKANTLLGSRGEEIALKYEQNRLRELGRIDLAKSVVRVSIEDDSPGYDILSFDENGKDRFIEVKTSSGKGKSVRFFMSANEYEVASSKDNYYVYYVEQTESETPKITIIKNPIDKTKFLILPDAYIFEAQR